MKPAPYEHAVGTRLPSFGHAVQVLSGGTASDFEQRVEERTREREKALAQMHQMQKPESLSHLTGDVAHDFNNLLMAILGNLDLVKKRLPPDARMLRLVDGAIQAADRGATLTKRMLAFARRQELKPEAVDVAKLVESIIEMLRRSVGPTMRIKTQFEPDLPLTCVDPNQLELGLLNLAVNARDAMPNGGYLNITARGERVSDACMPELAPGDYVVIGVSDTGCGMDEATRKQACEPFFTTKERGRGTGLGLSMVDGLVVQSGGMMRISSRLDFGTNVELRLPASVETEQRDRESLQEPSPCDGLRSFRVLVVDDDPIVRASTTAMIEDLGHSAIEAASAGDALDVLRSSAEIDVVITDYAMPGITGASLAAKTNRIRPGLPVVIATGYAEALQDAADLPRLEKPYRKQDSPKGTKRTDNR
jgi:signal transduction histidine kinase